MTKKIASLILFHFILASTFLANADIKPSVDFNSEGQLKYPINVRNAYSKAKPEVEFQVLRNGQLVSLSLDNPTDIKKVTDYDQIFLKEGFYNSLSRLTQKYIKFYGQNPRKTFVTFPAEAPLLADEQEFYFLTLFDITMLSLNGQGVYGASIHLVGEYPIAPPAHRFNTDFTMLLTYSFAKTRTLRDWHEDWTSPLLHGNMDIAYDDPFKFLSVIDPDKYGFNPATGRGALVRVKGNAHRFNSLFVTKVSQPTGSANMNLYEKQLSASKAAFKSDNIISGLMYLADADRAANYQMHHDIFKIAKPEVIKYRQDGACTVLFSMAQKESTYAMVKATELRTFLAAKMPIIDFAIPSPKCQIGVFAVSVNEAQTFTNVVKGKITEQVETQNSINRRQQADALRRMYEAAAERAAEKSQQARMAAAGEAMKSVTAKAQEGLARTENVGGQKAFVYGMGDWSANVSVETANAVKNNSDLSKQFANKANGLKEAGASYENVQRRVMEESAGGKSFWTVSVLISDKNKISEITSSKREDQEFRRTCTYVERNGFKQDLVCKNEQNSQYNAITSSIGPDTLKHLETKTFQQKRKLAAQKLKAKDDVSQLEGHVLSWVYGLSAPNPKTVELSEKLFGRKLNESDIFSLAMSF